MTALISFGSASPSFGNSLETQEQGQPLELRHLKSVSPEDPGQRIYEMVRDPKKASSHNQATINMIHNLAYGYEVFNAFPESVDMRFSVASDKARIEWQNEYIFGKATYEFQTTASTVEFGKHFGTSIDLTIHHIETQRESNQTLNLSYNW